MILQINEQFAITSDQHSWQISELRTRKRRGEVITEWTPILWFTTLEAACNELVQRSLRLSDACTLADALVEVENSVARLGEALRPSFTIRRGG